MRERFGHTLTIAVIGEDLPEHNNAVTIDDDLADSHGIPAPKVSYAMSENSTRMMDHGIDKSTLVLEAAGAKDVLVNPLLRPAGWHLMGTARMGADPETSVVDAEGRAHEVQNLYVIDGSILVTGRRGQPHVHNTSTRPLRSGAVRRKGWKLVLKHPKPICCDYAVNSSFPRRRESSLLRRLGRGGFQTRPVVVGRQSSLTLTSRFGLLRVEDA